MTLTEQFRQNIIAQHLFSSKDKLLLAVSGGVDSVVLCELCHQHHYDFIIAHCNFQLREDESERDENFVRSLGEKYNRKVVVKKFDTTDYASQHKISVQVAARELRYGWFYELLTPHQTLDTQSPNSQPPTPDSELPTPNFQLPTPNFLLTAHHADDQIETILLNFFKGTGISGLRGILPKQGKIIRPLLNFRKQELIEFANRADLKWVEDSSNSTDKYSRNYFRQHVIPMIEKIYPKAEDNLVDNSKRFADIEVLYNQAIAVHKKKLIEYKENEIHIPVLKLLKAEPLNSIVYEISKEYSFSPAQTQEIVALLDSDSGKFVQSASHRIIRNRKWLIIAPTFTEEARTIVIEEGEGEVKAPGMKLHFKALENEVITISADKTIAQLNKKQIEYPLLLRKWKTGDYFYPLGMKKKKKLARFFIDQKISKTEKEKIWVLESNKKIVWVVGHRIDDRFKIADNSKTVLQISVQHV